MKGLPGKEWLLFPSAVTDRFAFTVADSVQGGRTGTLDGVWVACVGKPFSDAK